VLGGDHRLSIDSVSGVLQYCAEVGRTLFVLWLDAHADFNTPATSPSGNLHGISAAWLCGEPGLPISEEPRVTLDPKNLHLFGVRAVDRGERDLLQSRGVNIVDMRQLDEFGAAVLMRRIIDEAGRRNGLIHVSLDVDFLDPQLAPGAGATVPGGATFREAHLVMEMLQPVVQSMRRAPPPGPKFSSSSPGFLSREIRQTSDAARRSVDRASEARHDRVHIGFFCVVRRRDDDVIAVRAIDCAAVRIDRESNIERLTLENLAEAQRGRIGLVGIAALYEF
jgi:hypothetical protein